MQVSDKLIRPLTEAKYLNADNVSRYRCIMRIFFEQYEKLKYWLYQEEVYEEMIQDPFFADYRMEQCQQDLMMLTEWKNLNTIQDTKKVASIEEFKNKKYRYQMTEYSVEIERLVIRLENLFIEGASLEPTLLERIRRSVERFPEMGERDQGGREDAPRLISLDEAFAGVDNRNIRDMFRLMTEFGFDFIINSQVLWGDCDTLDALAIYQLIRPGNAKFVTVMPYLWNGHKKELLEHEEEVEQRGIELGMASENHR